VAAEARGIAWSELVLYANFQQVDPGTGESPKEYLFAEGDALDELGRLGSHPAASTPWWGESTRQQVEGFLEKRRVARDAGMLSDGSLQIVYICIIEDYRVNAGRWMVMGEDMESSMMPQVLSERCELLRRDPRARQALGRLGME
jgi:hypothetical protein